MATQRPKGWKAGRLEGWKVGRSEGSSQAARLVGKSWSAGKQEPEGRQKAGELQACMGEDRMLEGWRKGCKAGGLES